MSDRMAQQMQIRGAARGGIGRLRQGFRPHFTIDNFA